MVETKTPSDGGEYARIAPFEFKLTAQKVSESSYEYNGLLSQDSTIADTNLVGTGESFTFEHFVQLIDPKRTESGLDNKTDEDGSVNMLVANFKYIDLPSTGGVGTYWFYILGAGRLAISFVLFRLSRKKIVQ